MLFIQQISKEMSVILKISKKIIRIIRSIPLKLIVIANLIRFKLNF